MRFARFWLAPVCVLMAAASFQGQGNMVARGRYLLEEVAKCQDCHTPRLPDGRPDRSKWLKGALLDFQPVRPVPAWRALAPDITPAGRLFQKWGDAGMINFLKTGLDPYGNRAGPPMPDYKLMPEDARAIVQYIKSLK